MVISSGACGQTCGFLVVCGRYGNLASRSWPRRLGRWPVSVDSGLLKLAEIGLRVASQYGFALAGGCAVQAHGILDRPSEDIDLFTAWERRDEFVAAGDAVVDGYRDVSWTYSQR